MSIQKKHSQQSSTDQVHPSRTQTLDDVIENIHTFQMTSLAPQLDNIAQWLREHNTQVAIHSKDQGPDQALRGLFQRNTGIQTAHEEDCVVILLLKLQVAICRARRANANSEIYIALMPFCVRWLS